MDALRFVAVGQDDPVAEPLLAELAVEYARRYGSTEDRVMAWLRSLAERLPADGDGYPIAFTKELRAGR